MHLSRGFPRGSLHRAPYCWRNLPVLSDSGPSIYDDHERNFRSFLELATAQRPDTNSRRHPGTPMWWAWRLHQPRVKVSLRRVLGGHSHTSYARFTIRRSLVGQMTAKPAADYSRCCYGIYFNSLMVVRHVKWTIRPTTGDVAGDSEIGLKIHRGKTSKVTVARLFHVRRARCFIFKVKHSPNIRQVFLSSKSV
jgi:hypothetical protein